MAVREELRGEADKLLLFLPMHGMNRPSKVAASSRFDLDEHQDLAILRHEVQFAQRRAEISGDNAVAFAAQVALGLRLSFLPKESSGVKNRHALVR